MMNVVENVKIYIKTHIYMMKIIVILSVQIRWVKMMSVDMVVLYIENQLMLQVFLIVIYGDVKHRLLKVRIYRSMMVFT